MLFTSKINKIKNYLKKGNILKTSKKSLNKICKNKMGNSLLSSILRIFLSVKLIFRFYFFLKKRNDVLSINQFWIIRVGFRNRRKYLPYIKLDPHLSNNPFCCSNLYKLPFNSESCQIIYVKHFFKYFPRNIEKSIKSLKKKLIPGGILKIQVNLKKNQDKFEILKRVLTKNNFFLKEINNSDLKVNGCVTIIAFKQKKLNLTSIPAAIEKFKDIVTVLKQYKKIYNHKEKICILGYNSKKMLQKLNIHISLDFAYENTSQLRKISENYFDCAIVVNFLEYCNYSSNNNVFEELKRILKPNANMIVIVPEKKHYSTIKSAQFFDKGIFTRILDENNIKFKWINLSTSFKMIQVYIKNEHSSLLSKNKTKVFLLGNYSLRYTFLNNARWDSQARAFEKLGYDIQIYDIKDNSFNYLMEHIKLFNPDILWLAGKVAYDFLKKYANFFKNSNIKVVYWLWDIITPVKFDFKGIIDYMFITSRGEIPLYKKVYNLDKVFYMPVSIMPEIIHRNKFIKEVYEIGFSGQLSYSHPYYKERTEMLDIAKKYFDVKIFKNMYTNLPEYYSKCKIIFGGTPYFKDIDSYASNRPYIALAGGCCFITNYFKGLEKLAENKKHLLWYSDKSELKTLLEKYLSDDLLREEVKKNARKLAKEKHNYIARITNMLDIINGKTENFYGFIN